MCALQNKDHVAQAVKDELTKAMSGFGYEVIQVRAHPTPPLAA